MKQAYRFEAHYNGRTAEVVAVGERDAFQKAVDIFKPAKHRQPAVHVEKKEAITITIEEKAA